MRISSALASFCAVLTTTLAVGYAHAEEAPVPAAAEKTPSGPKLARGLLMKQGQKLVLAPCRDRSYAFVEDVSNGQVVTEALRRLGVDDGKKIYVELWTTIEGVILRADEVNFARTEGRCQPPTTENEAWQAAGLQPEAWNLSIGGGKLALYRASQPELQLEYQSLVDAGKTVHLESQGVAIDMARGQCFEPASRAVFGWSATVKLADGTSLRGCAWQR